jgi:uncharacterized protein
MFEQLGLDGWTPVQASLVLGIALGLVFGAAAQRSRFCLRRGLAGPADERRPALGVWAMALAVAIPGTQLAAALGWIDFADHRFTAARVPVVALVGGGLAFGAGMVLTRGCASRITVLAASGNLRSALCLAVFALTALATLRGALAPVRESLSAPAFDAGALAGPAGWPGGGLPWALVLGALLVVLALRSGAARRDLVLGGVIGVLVPLAWVGTGLVLLDEFDPIPMQALTYTSSTMDAVFWFTAATAVAPGFGAGLFGGTLVGAAAAALLSGDLRLGGVQRPGPDRALHGGRRADGDRRRLCRRLHGGGGPVGPADAGNVRDPRARGDRRGRGYHRPDRGPTGGLTAQPTSTLRNCQGSAGSVSPGSWA